MKLHHKIVEQSFISNSKIGMIMTSRHQTLSHYYYHCSLLLQVVVSLLQYRTSTIEAGTLLAHNCSGFLAPVQFIVTITWNKNTKTKFSLCTVHAIICNQ